MCSPSFPPSSPTEPLDELEHVKEKDFVEMTTIDGQEMRSTASHVQELAGQVGGVRSHLVGGVRAVMWSHLQTSLRR